MNKFVIALFVAACFVATASATKPEPKDVTVPQLAKGEPMLVKGENAKIFVNEAVLYDDDKNLRKGSIHIELKKNNLVVNDKVVLKQNPNAPIIKNNPKLKARNVDKFEINVDKEGQVTYVVKTSI